MTYFSAITFNSQISGVSGAYAQQVLAGDFNGDGIIDLAVPFSFGNGTQPGPIVFFLGDGHGGFADSTSTLFANQNPRGIYDARILGGDFNNDGRTDVLGLDFGQDAAPFNGGQSELWLSSSSGMFNATANLPQRLEQTHGGVVGDINRDGNTDAILLNLNVQNGGALEILIGDGTGHFQLANQLVPASYRSSGYNAGNTWGTLVDVNNDGYPDLIAGTWEASTLPSEVYLNDHGSFANASPIPLPDSGVARPNVMQIQSIDLNGDSLADLVLSITNGSSPGVTFYTVPYLQFLINDGGGHFHDETSTRLPGQALIPNAAQSSNWIKFIQSVDLNGDGATDLVTQRWIGSGITSDVYLNDGSGHFTLVGTIPGEATAIANFDGLGHAAFAVVLGNRLEVVTDDLPQIGPGIVRGTTGNDVFVPASATGTFDGLGGLDTIRFPSPQAAYVVSGTDSLSVVTAVGETYSLSNIERIQFSDQVMALDIQGNAGNAYRLYQAAFNRTPDTAGLSFWVHALDQGVDVQTVAAGFVNAAEFKSVYGNNPTHAHIVDLMYQNVLGRAGEPAGINFWVGQLDNGLSVGALLQGFAISSENHGIVDPKIAQGIVLDHTAFLV